MALSRLALKNLQQKLSSCSSTLLNSSQRNLNNVQKQRWCSELVRRFSTEAAVGKEKTETQEIAVSEGGKKSKLFPRRRRRGNLWRRNDSDFAPALWENLPSGLGNALLQATENINRIFENLNLSPSQLMGRYKEDEKSYKIRYDLPGLSKEDVKITVENGVVTIKGEHKEEQEEGSDDEFWSSSRSYGYYNNSIVLPEDAKVDEIKAEMKDGVLTIVIPKTEIPKKDVKEIQVM
ncbi:PREDICTED: 26.5 kDa heat shock protein, mitochondrial-like [Nicotiana attenuata]|uniref:26.5 kDa heat shock protein, mitochondrial n=1 Tax=Nicotiana attenuata TaxID=49451 RepID=A0A1J6I620_NICAT|nr:PREDICTED: 26.5 kDa heat shock protein, mitochondrial-like [Nicotiana attenuata]OIS96007.1 26.5 kda heat shock protein, mitochondrial [Nicotiana attenuata]